MPNFNDVLGEINDLERENAYDIIRRRYLDLISRRTKRNVITYYSGFLQKTTKDSRPHINNNDLNAFMLAVHRLKRSKGLDLILHTPGGQVHATESIVEYLYSMFGSDIRVIVPHMAMSGGTMIGLSSKEIIMGKHSQLGPIDPQINGYPCLGLIDEFSRALKEVSADPSKTQIWLAIISKYNPTLIGACEKAIQLSRELAKKWLERNMCAGDAEKASRIFDFFTSDTIQKFHGRPVMIDACKSVDLTVTPLENDQRLQDYVLTLHHAYMHTFANTTAVKIVENHLSACYVDEIAE